MTAPLAALPEGRLASPRHPLGMSRRWVQGIEYLHGQLTSGGDLFLTRYGIPFARQLQPENWFSPDWFAAHRRRLRGTSTIYKVTTRPVDGSSLELIVRYSRVGEAVPLDTASNENFLNAEFNSPFEEIARVMQLRVASLGANRRRILTKRPLAIYQPPERLELWQTGRSADKIAAKRARHPGTEISIHRQYLLIYGWIDGVDAEEAADRLGLAPTEREDFLQRITRTVEAELAEVGFRVLDMKPAHIIVRMKPDGSLLSRRDGRPAYALVDYELLERISAEEVSGKGAVEESFFRD